MKKILILLKLMLLALFVSGQPTITWPDSNWNRKTLNSNVFVTGGLVADSSIITLQDFQADSINADYISIDATSLFSGNLTAGGDIVPSATNSKDLGKDSLVWDSAYFGDVVVSTSLGIGMTPTVPLEVVTTSTNIALRVINQKATGSGVGAGLQVISDDGAAMSNGDRLGFHLFAGAEDAANTYHSSSGFESYATENWSAAANGANLIFQVTANGATSRTDAMTINNDASIEMAGDLTVTGTQTLFAYMTFDDSSYVLDLTQNIFSPITNAANDLFTTGATNGVTVTGDSIQIVTAGTYKVTFNLSYSGSNTDEYHGHLFVNGTELSNVGFRRGMTTSKAGVTCFTYIGVFSANDWITPRIENTANNNDATLLSGSLSVEKL